VGQEPEPFPLVGGANGGCGQQTPFRIEPHRGKVGEDVGESVFDELGDVLQEDESGSHVTDDPGDPRPEPTVIDNATLESRGRERLAGEAGSDEIHSSNPRRSVEGVEVRPDRRPIQGRVFHPRHESGRCVGIPLNMSHGSGWDSGESQGELSSVVSRAEVEGT